VAVVLSEEIALLVAPVAGFLACRTPDAWLQKAAEPAQLSALLIDHANCEVKAAMTAHSMIRRYCLPKGKKQLIPNLDFYQCIDVEEGGLHEQDFLEKRALTAALNSISDITHNDDILAKMARLAREEIHHFEQVIELMKSRDIPYAPMPAGRYAKAMLTHVRTYEPEALIDKLIIGAFIEARSCERFAALAPLLDDELAKFYISLLRSEARHYSDYLELAQSYSKKPIAERVAFFAQVERDLILTPDTEFRFHSGVPHTGVPA
jgi:tRNA-(ms[2]io[6]A)-hydroxylase